MVNNAVWGKCLKAKRIWELLDVVSSTENKILSDKITHYLIELEANCKAKYMLVFNTVWFGLFYILFISNYSRAPPLKDFIKKSLNGGQRMTEKEEYTPLIRVEEDQIKYFVVFKDIHMQLNRIQVTKEVFLQFFGIHQHYKNLQKEHYYIAYENRDVSIKKEVTKEEYRMYQSFRSIEIREHNIYQRYIEHKELSEAKLFQRSRQKESDTIIDTLYKQSIVKALHEAIASLPEIQRRRLVLHCVDGLSLAQIAQKERCSKSSIQSSIRIALCALYEKLKKFKD